MIESGPAETSGTDSCLMPEAGEPQALNGEKSGSAAEPYGEPDDRVLAQAALDGCLESFEALVSRYEDRLFRFLLQKTGDHHHAEDLLQVTFVTAHRKIHLYKALYPFSTWLYTIAKRLAINHYRRIKPTNPEPVNLATEENPRSAMMASEQARSIWDCARRNLTEAQFTVTWLFYGEDMSIRNISIIMKTSEGSVKVLLHRARRKLANEIQL